MIIPETFCRMGYFISRMKVFLIMTMLVLVTGMSLPVNAQTTYQVGSGKTYTTLKDAFDAINAGTLSGDIVLQIISDLTETSSAILNASGIGTATYNSIIINPDAASRTISGNLTGVLINLNGADHVTFDGLNTGGGSLTIRNTSTSASTISFSNDACNNTITNCTIEGSGTGAAVGTIQFLPGTATGNDGNTISNNVIKGAGSNLPTNAVFSNGNSVAIDNSGNTISNNFIRDYFNGAAASNGILISSNSSAWTITGNRFYETSPCNTTSTGYIHHAINITTPYGNNYVVSSNIIGFSNELGTGITSFTGAFATLYRAIEMTVGSDVASSVQGNTISGIALTTTSGLATAPGILTGIYINGGTVNIGTVSGNTIGGATATDSIFVSSTTSLGYIAGIYATSGSNIAIQNNTIRAISTGGSATMGYTFHGINTAGGGNFTISGNTIGSAIPANSIDVGNPLTTSGVCAFNGITNAATGVISITDNTVLNGTAYGTAGSTYNGITNTAGIGTLNITGNNVIAGTNYGTGAMTGISNSAIVATLNMNSNIIRSHVKPVVAGAFTALSNTVPVTTAININNNQLGNLDGGLATFNATYSGVLTGINNTGGAASAALSIQGNDIRGITHSVAGSSSHTYIYNTANTLTQNINNNTFTNLDVNTTGSVTFISVSSGLYATGTQTISGNSIVTAFNKSGGGGTVIFCNGSGISQPGSVITHSLNNFSNVTVTGATTITGWSNTNSSLNKTVSNNTFNNWTGGSAALTVMTVTGGGSTTISGNTIGNMTTAAALAPITAISSGGSGAMVITDNVISGLVSGSGAFINSFTGITNSGGADVTITGNSITGCTAGGTAASIYTGIANAAVGVGTLTITGNSVTSGTNAGTGAFNAISNASTTAFVTANINNNIIRSNVVSSTSGAFTAISNAGAITNTININNNQLGNEDGGLVTFSGAPSSGALTCISNTGGTATAALSILENNIQGIIYSGAGGGAHTYITNSANTLSQNISNNTFTNLDVNTTGSVTFFNITNGLFATGIQTVSGNSIVTAFNKSGAGGTVTFCNESGTSQPGSVITQNSNNFSHVTVAGGTAINGWSNTNTSLNKTVSNNTFIDWTGGSAGITVMAVTGGGSTTISGNTIDSVTTTALGTAPIVAINSGGIGAMVITNNILSGLVTGSGGYINTFTGITNSGGTDVTITGNNIIGCTAGGTGKSLFKGIEALTTGSGTLTITGNSIISGTNAGTGTPSVYFTAINNTAPFATANISNNIIRSNSITSTNGAFTAISNSGVVTTAITINDNHLGNADGGLVNYTLANSAALTGISNTGGAISCALSIQNNDIWGVTQDVTGLNAHNYILNSAVTLSQNISYNTFTNLSVNTSGAITFLTNNVVLPTNGVQNVNSNRIVTAFNRTASSGALTLYSSTTATNNANVTVNNNNNDFSNITINGTASIAGWINTDAGMGNVTKTIDGNTFTKWSAGTGTGSITVLSVGITSPNNVISNNSINTITSAGTITGITSGAGNDNIFSNTIHTLTSTGIGATIVNGIAVTAGTLKNVYRNTIYNLQANNITTGSVSGISVSGGVTNVVNRNKIYNISSSSSGITGSVNGVWVNGTTIEQITTLHNNTIGDIKATAANVSNPVCGISITNTGVRSLTNVYFNTIFLNATSSGGLFGTSGIYHAASTFANTGALDLRNNIIVNLSTFKGTGQTVAFRRSASTAGMLANYAPSSNNNLFYSGTPSANNLLYYDGTVTTAQNIADYKAGAYTAGTIAPRDQASISESPSFLSTTGADADYLKINTATSTQIESGAVNIPSITTDFDGTTRQGNLGYGGASLTAPDIGADEGDFTLIDNCAPSITYSPLTSTACLSNPSITANIIDASGVNTTLGTKPRLYFKRSTDADAYIDNTSGTNCWKWVEASETSSPYNFTFNYSLLNGGTGVAANQIIQYFIVAQDLAVTPNVGINNGRFANAPTSVALTSGAFGMSGVINSFTILPGLNGAVTIGATGTYPSLTGVGGLFSNINNKGLNGNIVATIVDGTITESGGNSLNAIIYDCGNNYTVTIMPKTGVAVTLTGSVAGPLINLNSADHVIIDGLNTAGSSLTIQNTNTTTSASTISFSNDACNNTITNCTIEGSGTNAGLGTIQFLTGAITGNDGNTISKNVIKSAGSNMPTNAILSSGYSVAVGNSGNTISNNFIRDYFNAVAASNGIYIASNSSAWTITGNRFYETLPCNTTSTGYIHHAINITTQYGGNYVVSGNIIGFSSESGTGTTSFTGAFATIFRAIEMSVGADVASSVQGNTIAGISLSTTSGTATAPGIFTGIYINGGTVNVGTVTGNTIGSATGNSSITVASTTSLGYLAGIYATTGTNVSIQNNAIGALSTGGATNMGYTFNGINTAGGGNFTISGNTIGSTSTANSISVGSGATTSPVCTFNGIANAATGIISVTGNTVQNCTSYGTAASVYNGIVNSGGVGTLSIMGNNVIAGKITGTGMLTGISNSAALANLNINGNVIRNDTITSVGGTFTAISNSITGVVTTAININNNQLGNADGGLINYTTANSGLLYGIYNMTGTATAALNIQENDIRGITYSVMGSGAHTYIYNTANTLTQNISNNTFTNLNVNTTGSVTFINVTSGLFPTGTQTVNGNSIVTAFNKSAAGGTVTFCNGTGTSQPGSIISQNLNNFSSVTVTGSTILTGWINSNSSLNKTFNNNKFNYWTGGVTTLTVLNVTGGASIISNDTINNMTTASGTAPIVAISTGANGSMVISDNILSNLVTAGGAYVNSFTGITNNGGTDVTITGNTISDCTASGTGLSLFTGITAVTAGSGALTITGNRILNGTNAGTGAFTAINNGAPFATANLSNNIIRSNTITSNAGTFTAISNAGVVTTVVNINNNQLGNADGGLINYNLSNSGALYGISNSAGTATCALTVQNNDVRGITHSVVGSSTHTYISNTAVNLTQNISNNTFTNLIVNTTGNVTFIYLTNGLFATGTQTVNGNSIVTAFNKSGASGIVTFCNATGTSQPGSIITQNQNNFSSVTVTGATTITGWINNNTSLNKTINTNTFSNWTGGTTTLTVMSVTGGASTLSGNTLSNMTTASGTAPIVAINSGASGAMVITNNLLSGLVSASGSNVNSFTGITNNAGTDVTITGNTIIGCTAGGTGLSIFTGIAAVTAGSGTLTISGNNIISGTNAGIGATATFTAISNGATFATANISNNIIRSNTVTSISAPFTAISNTGIVTTAVNINNNQLGNEDGGLVTFSGVTSSGALLGISNTASAISCALSIQNNDIRGILHSGAGSSAHTYIINTATALLQNICNNTFTNLNVNTTGNVTFLSNSVSMPVSGVQNVNSNAIVTAFAKTGAGGIVTLFTSIAATSNNNVTVSNNSNNFSNITVNGSTTIAGWINTDAGTGNVTKTIDGNTFANWTAGTGTGAITVLSVGITSPNNTISNNNINTISSAGSITGIVSAAGNDNIFLDTIHSLISSGTLATVVNGISITAGTFKNIYRNTIYNLQANNISTGSVNGILVSGTATDQVVTLYNNIIGDLKATAANGANTICGISVTNTGLRSVTNVFFNTINLSATSSGGTFGTSGIYHAASAVANTGALDLRNNIIVNQSTFKGSGLTVAFRRSAGSAGMLANYASTSNNNLFYAGTPGVNNLIYNDGTSSAQTLAVYKAGAFIAGTIAPRDLASISENLTFMNTTGTDPNFLKLANGTVTFMESGAVNIPGITTDKIGGIRAGNPGYPAQLNGGGTAPDMGAFEFDGFVPHLSISNSNSNGYYESLTSAFNAINAQDQTSKNILISILSSTNETVSSNLNAGNWTSLNVFPIVTGLTLVGNLNGTSLINLNGADNVTIDGRVNQTGTNIDLNIVNNSTSATTGTSTIRFLNSAEHNCVKYCTIKGSSTSTSDGILTFSTSSFGNGNDNNLIDVCNLSNVGGNRPVNVLFSNGTSGHENSQNTISNSNIYDFLNPSASSNGINISANSTEWAVTANSFYETTSFVPIGGTLNYSALRIDNASGTNFSVTGNYFGGKAALCGGLAWSTDAATDHNLSVLSLNVGTSTASSVQNNSIRNWNYRSASATPWTAVSVTGGNVNIGTVTTNTIGSDVVANDITLTATNAAESFGIKNSGTGSVVVSKNKICSVHLVGDNVSFDGIYFAGSTGSNSVNNNFIHSLSVDPTSTTSTLFGIKISSGTATYSNNIISLGGNTATTLYGIYETGSVATENKLYFNTIYIGGILGSGISNRSYALYSNTSANIRDIRNNIFANFRSTTGGTCRHYAVYLNYSVNTNLNLGYNNYYAPGVGGMPGFFDSTNKTTLPIATGQDAKSLISNPGFMNAGTINSADYKVGIPFVGVSGTGIAIDFESIARDLPVNMGAFEYYPIKWKGTISSDFADVANWTTSTVPTGAQIAGISPETPFHPVISGSDVTFSGSGRVDLTSGATLTLASGPLLTLATGSTVTTAAGARIILKSDARYLNLSSNTPTLEVQRELKDTKGWRMVSSPVKGHFSDMFKNPLVTQGFAGSDSPELEPNLLWWLESDKGTTLQSWRQPTNISDTLVYGRGYFHYVFDGAGIVSGEKSGQNYSDVLPLTMSVTGVENYNGSGTFDYHLTYTPKPSKQNPSLTDTTYYDLNSLDQGWNLIGNPTASTLDWDAAAGWSKNDIDNTIYVWNPSPPDGDGAYLEWNGFEGTLGDGLIPPFQAFWIHATDSTILSFTNEVKSSTYGVFHRSAQVENHISVPITLTMGDLHTTSFISFSENGVTGPDRWDGYCLESMSDNWLKLYTLSSPGNVSPLVINHLPLLKDNLVDIPLYYGAQIKGSTSTKNCTLSWSLPENWPSDWNISLLDNQTEQSISMTEQSSYSYKMTTTSKSSALLGKLSLPNKLIKSLIDTSLLRSASSVPPFTIIIAKGKDIEYMAPKPQLLGNFPNPFATMTTIRFSLPQKAKTHIEVYTSLGQKIATVADGNYPAGITEVRWDAKSNTPGMYIIRFICGETVETKKAILII